MKRFLTPFFLLALLAVLPAGCNNPAKQIAVGLKIELTGIVRESDGTATIAWQVDNPNVVSYIVSRVSHKIYLNGTYLGQAGEEEPIAIPAQSKAGGSVKLTVSDAAATAALSAAATTGSGSYRVDSRVLFRIYDDNVQQSDLSNSGTVPVTAK